jgi:hypothetical protein
MRPLVKLSCVRLEALAQLANIKVFAEHDDGLLQVPRPR